MGVVVRVAEAQPEAGGPLRLVVAGLPDEQLDRLRAAWAASGSSVRVAHQRLHAISTVDALARAAGRALPAPVAEALEREARTAVAAWSGPTPPLALPRGVLGFDAGPAIMGIVNVTPDSFSDGGGLYPADHPDAALAAAWGHVADGATIVDVGGESTRPGADDVDPEAEIARVLPVIERLATGPASTGSRPVISIDTTKPEVARQAVAAGADVVNDVSGGSPELLDVVASSGAGYVLMHRRGTPKDMQQRTAYDDVVAEVFDFLAEGVARCVAAGVSADRVAVDPGIGFAKTSEHNLALLHAVPQLRGLGRPLVIGASRKGFLGVLLDGAPVEERLEGSLACAVMATADGAAILRVHDVAPTVRATRVAHAVARAGDLSETARVTAG